MMTMQYACLDLTRRPRNRWPSIPLPTGDTLPGAMNRVYGSDTQTTGIYQSLETRLAWPRSIFRITSLR